MIQGCVDVLVIQGQFWITVIEAKNSEFSLTKAMSQALAYMLAAPNSNKPIFGAVLNGSEFLFLKLLLGKIPQYATSDVFSLFNRGNNFYQVLQVFKAIKYLMQPNFTSTVPA